MKMLLPFLLLIGVGLANAQRFPPGVNPKRYRVPEPLPQHQEPSHFVATMPQPQIPIQNYQIPVQQPPKVLNPGHIHRERAHIQEHMPVSIDTNYMSDEELQFHYFKMHDSDDNNMLDGCELLKSLTHLHEQDSKEQAQPDKRLLTDQELAALIDPILKADDTSDDGYIDYMEFIKAQKKKVEQQQQPVV